MRCEVGLLASTEETFWGISALREDLGTPIFFYASVSTVSCNGVMNQSMHYPRNSLHKRFICDESFHEFARFHSLGLFQSKCLSLQGSCTTKIIQH